MSPWDEHLKRERSRYEDGSARLPDDPMERQRQLTRLANAAYGAGLAALMLADAGAAETWFARAAERYRESYEHAPPGSWGRPLGAMKARILALDWEGAAAAAEWTLDAGAARSESPIAQYAAALAFLVLGEHDRALIHADAIRTRDDFPRDVADALAYLAGDDPLGYDEAVAAVLESFETRNEYLEDVPVADTVLVLQALAARRGMAVLDLASPLLPATAG